jgi:hypothetical protein
MLTQFLRVDSNVICNHNGLIHILEIKNLFLYLSKITSLEGCLI